MTIAVIGNGLTATFAISLLLERKVRIIHCVDPYKVPHSWASAGIVHPFNFKTASWKKFGYQSYADFLEFLTTWKLHDYFHPVGLLHPIEHEGLWNDWNALSVRFPEFIQITSSESVFFPKSGYLQVKKVWDILNHQFLKFPHYERLCQTTLPNLPVDYILHAGGIEALHDHPHLPLYPQKSKIFKVLTPEPFLPYIYWKHFFVVPTQHPLQYWVGPEAESLKLFQKTFAIDYQILQTMEGIKPYSLTGRAFCIQEKQTIFLNGVGGRGILEGLRIAKEALTLLL